MRRLSRRLSERTRLKSLTTVMACACWLAGAEAAHAGSLLEPGTTTYTLQLESTDPVTVGRDHNLILDTQGEMFGLVAPVVNQGTVRVKTYDDGWQEALFAVGPQVNSGQWILGDQLAAYFVEGAVNNRSGTFQIGKDSVLSVDRDFIGGTIHGTSATSELWAGHLSDVALSGQVVLRSSGGSNQAASAGPTKVSGTLTVDGTLHVRSMQLAADTALTGGGKTVLAGAWIGAAPGAPGAQLTIATGHTLTGNGSLSDIALINRGALTVEADRTLAGNAIVTQQGAGAVMQVAGQLIANEVWLEGGVINLSGRLGASVTVEGGTLVVQDGGVVDGDLDVRAGRVSVNASSSTALWDAPVFAGDIALSDTSELEVIVSSSSDHLLLGVNGTAKLGGKLIVTFAEGARPTAPDFLLMFEAMSDIQGTFTSVEVQGAGDFHWRITDRQGPLYALVISSIPEPQTWVLLLCGLGMMTWQVRRRRSSPGSWRQCTPALTAPTSRSAGACSPNSTGR